MIKLLPPVDPFKINQYFGSNGAYYQANGINIKGHNGVDLQAKHGQPVYASHDGYATYEIDEKGGCGVVVKADGFKTIYWHFVDGTSEPKHMSPINNFKINPVKAGDLLGYADSTGLSTGDHLHWGLKLIDSQGVTLNSDNGYLGAIDPLPYLDGYIPAKYYFNKDFGIYSTNVIDVMELQKRLVNEHYGNFLITGFFGLKTEKALKAYQDEHGILTTGFCGPKTRACLNM